MKPTLSLPLVKLETLRERLLPAVPRLPHVEWVQRKSPLLHTGPAADQPDVLALNIANGCAHRCTFCSVRAYPSYRGDDVVYLPSDLADRLAQELASRRERPRAVVISPSTDPCMPLVEVQAATAQAVEVLAAHGVEAWLATRGLIRPRLLDVLARHRQRVRVTVGMTTVDRTWQRALEPLAAPPKLRLRQLAALREAGIPVNVQAAPLIPGVTDLRPNLEALLAALAEAGVQQISAGYLFLRQGIQENLTAALKLLGFNESVLHEYGRGLVLAAGGLQAARYLSRQRRQQGYAVLMTLAAAYGIGVRICALTNPDFVGPRLEARPAPRLFAAAPDLPARRRSPAAG